MEFSMRSFVVVSLLLLVSLSTDMSGLLVVDAQKCQKYCPGLHPWSPCTATFPYSVKEEITEEVMADALIAATAEE